MPVLLSHDHASPQCLVPYPVPRDQSAGPGQLTAPHKYVAPGTLGSASMLGTLSSLRVATAATYIPVVADQSSKDVSY